MKTIIKITCCVILTLLIVSCKSDTNNNEEIKTDENGYILLTDEQIENIVRRSYQYVALYNVNNKFAITYGSWNELDVDTQLKDHTLTDIARPNNDSFYSGAMLDLRNEPYVISWPKFDSKYVSLMVTAYDHYVNVPRSTRVGDFNKPEKMLFYSQRTENYKGEAVEGIDEIYEVSGDFVSVVFRVMPHANEPERFAKVVDQIQTIELQSLSEFKGEEPIIAESVNFPDVGNTNADIYENNFLEVMQFVVNHLTFDGNDELDTEFLKALKQLGIEPGKEYSDETAVKIDVKKFRKVAEDIQMEYLGKMTDGDILSKLAPLVFKPKGQTSLEALVAVSVIGPIGLPLEEAFYPAVSTDDGEVMNAMNDYVIKMNKDELPPAKAFWSLTLYDKANGFFIPNDHKKYSVGENAGMKLNEDGGIEIYVAAEKPDGVPKENWLPINRKDEDIDIILRVYVPELEKLDTWTVPVASKL
jgi:hypothetical protein